jgi:2-methylisocitrate lyase-like PEP mutase family enzyme
MQPSAQLAPEDQYNRGVAFAALHDGPRAFVIPNPWDAGTARLLTGLGFAALATTSAGLAFSLGRKDGENLITRDEALANARAIVAATHLPVAADLENGFGVAPDVVAETIRRAAEAGLVGGSIEDATGDPDAPIHSLEAAAERIAAAAEAARSLAFPFTLTARAENFLHGNPDLKDTVRRLQAYEAAGADVLYAPGLPDVEAVRVVLSEVGRPVNVLVGGSPSGPSVSELSDLGVRRISLGSNLYKVAASAFVAAAGELRDCGTYGFSEDMMSFGDLQNAMSGKVEG